MKLTMQASQTEQVGKSLLVLGIEHEDIVVLDPDVSASTKTTYFAERFPERFIKVGISEQDMIGIAAGLAASGKMPIACGFAIFVSGRAWEQVANSVARPGLNVKIIGTHSGLSPSADGSSHQAIGDVSLMRVLPNMVVVVPADAHEAVQALRALIDLYGPAYLRIGRGDSPLVYEEECDLIIGKANTLKEGADATIIANGVMVFKALQAAEKLIMNGLNVQVVDMHTIKPLDKAAIENAAKETGAIVTAEEHNIIGGLGSAVTETLAELRPTPMFRVGIRDRFGESSRSYDDLMKKMGLTPNAIVEAVHEVISRRDKKE